MAPSQSRLPAGCNCSCDGRGQLSSRAALRHEMVSVGVRYDICSTDAGSARCFVPVKVGSDYRGSKESHDDDDYS
jgi:hypothetical protein